MSYNVDGKGGSAIKFWIGELYNSEDKQAENELEERGLQRPQIEAIKAGQVYNLKGVISDD